MTKDPYSTKETTQDDSPYSINPDLTRRRAKELFLIGGWTKSDLLELGIPETTLNTWLYKPTQGTLSWHQEKEMFERSIMSRLKEQKAEELTESMGRGVNILKRSLLELDLAATILTVHQMEKLTNTIGKLDHIINLEKGKPTSIRQNLELNQAQIDELVKELDSLDPLIDYSPKKFN